MKSLSSKNPFLKAGGGTPDIDFIHLLLLGGTGVGKSTAVLAIINYLYNQNPASKFIISEMKQSDYLFAEHLPNVYLGDRAILAIDVAFNEIELRKKNRGREKTPYYLVVEELTSLFELAGKSKKEYQERIRVILYTGRAFNVKLLAVSQDLLASALGEGSARNQFSLVIALGSLRSSVTRGLFELDEGQELQKNLPKRFGYLQRFDDGSNVIKIKVKQIPDINLLKGRVLDILGKSADVAEAVGPDSL